MTFAFVLGVMGQLIGLSPRRASASRVAAFGRHNRQLGATLLHDSNIKGYMCAAFLLCDNSACFRSEHSSKHDKASRRECPVPGQAGHGSVEGGSCEEVAQEEHGIQEWQRQRQRHMIKYLMYLQR